MPQTEAHNEDDLVSTSEAARILGVHGDTLRRYEERGLISAKRTPTNHRRFRVGDLHQLRDAEAGAA
jgi:excisionase family DNA binding protein